jgi:hypothetical protein
MDHMDGLRISRRSLVGAAAAGMAGAMLASNAVFADEDDRERVDVLRWDLTQEFNNVVVAGGKDAAIITKPGISFGDTLTLTGSGIARVKKGVATGGGTFTNVHATGVESAKLGHGIYYVTGFNSFVNGGGRLASTMNDTIGNSKRTTGGVLSLNVVIVSPPKASAPPGTPPDSAPGVLKIHCSLPGGQADTEGIEFNLSPAPTFVFNFVQSTGTSLFHVMDE